MSSWRTAATTLLSATATLSLFASECLIPEGQWRTNFRPMINYHIGSEASTWDGVLSVSYRPTDGNGGQQRSPTIKWFIVYTPKNSFPIAFMNSLVKTLTGYSPFDYSEEFHIDENSEQVTRWSCEERVLTTRFDSLIDQRKKSKNNILEASMTFRYSQDTQRLIASQDHCYLKRQDGYWNEESVVNSQLRDRVMCVLEKTSVSEDPTARHDSL